MAVEKGHFTGFSAIMLCFDFHFISISKAKELEVIWNFAAVVERFSKLGLLTTDSRQDLHVLLKRTLMKMVDT